MNNRKSNKNQLRIGCQCRLCKESLMMMALTFLLLILHDEQNENDIGAIRIIDFITLQAG